MYFSKFYIWEHAFSLEYCIEKSVRQLVASYWFLAGRKFMWNFSTIVFTEKDHDCWKQKVWCDIASGGGGQIFTHGGGDEGGVEEIALPSSLPNLHDPYCCLLKSK